MVSYPHYPRRRITLLDGIWDFNFSGGEQCDTGTIDINLLKFGDRTAVPGCFDTDPAYAGKRGIAAYRRMLNIRPGRKALLKFHGLGISHWIYVDQVLIAQDSLPYSGFTVELPCSDNPQRELLVIIDNRFDFGKAPLQEQFFDFYAYGGIFRSIELLEVPPQYISRLRILPLDIYSGKVLLQLYSNYKGETLECLVSFDNQPPHNVTLQQQDGYFSAELLVPEPRLWSSAAPNLHTITLETLPSDVSGDSITERFGLRTVAAEDGKVLINGKAVKLLGFCRHETHPQYGPALPLQQLVQDLKLLRELGCNFIRGAHYPQDQRFLDLCDELGFLVFEESLAWGQREKQLTDPIFQKLQIRQTRLMVQNSFNHPSVIIWGFLNEGASNAEYARPLYESLLKTLRDSDPGRLVTYATMFPFDDLFLDQVDLISVNKYPGWYPDDMEAVRPLAEIPEMLDQLQAERKRRGLEHKPLLISEIGAGAFYGWRDPLKAHWSEEYQADLLELVAAEVLKRDELAGVSFWQFCDCRTYASGYALKRPRAFNNKGILDEYRRPKLAFERVKQCFAGQMPSASRQ